MQRVHLKKFGFADSQRYDLPTLFQISNHVDIFDLEDPSVEILKRGGISLALQCGYSGIVPLAAFPEGLFKSEVASDCKTKPEDWINNVWREPAVAHSHVEGYFQLVEIKSREEKAMIFKENVPQFLRNFGGE
jgi:hypothetical protein